jgi:hypothetical protein
MKTTLGELIADLYDLYVERSEDPELAAIATASAVNELLCEQARRGKPARGRATRLEHHATL